MAESLYHAANRAYFDQKGGNLNLNGANLYDSGPNPLAQQITFTIAAITTNTAGITMQVADGAGVAIAQVFELEWFLSDAATGVGLTATTASGAVGAAASSGADIYTKVSKKAGESQTLATGAYTLSILDTANTGFYVGCYCPGTGRLFVSRQLVAGDY